jgi:hypothetical protein
MRGFLTSIAALAVCGFSVASIAAVPQEPVSPQAGSWIVAPISGGQFCSMKNVWQDGRRLVFARDAQGGNSVAVDFGAKILQAGHQYPVTLDLPPLLTRDMTAVAATEQILLVGMGKDADFYGALGRASALYLTALNKEYGFDLAGSTDALRELGGCASGLAGAPKSVEAEPRPAAPKPVRAAAKKPVPEKPEIKENREDAAALAQAAALRVENERLRKDLSEARRVADRAKDAAAETSRLKAALDVAQGAQKENEALDAENDRLREELSSAKQEAAARRGLGDQVKSAQAENARLKTALAATATAQKQSTALQDENERLNAALAKAQQDLVSSADAVTVAPATPLSVAAEPDRIIKILGNSGVVPKGGLVTHDAGGIKTFKWQSGGILGSAEEARLGAGDNFSGRVNAWLDRMASRCKDDFARAMGKVESFGRMTVQKAEVACIADGGQGAGAAVLFVGDGATFSAIMHEAASDTMETALAKRNAVALAVVDQAQ